MKIPILRISYTEEEISHIKVEIEQVLRSGYLTMADNVRQFEKQFAQFCGTKYAIGTNSGTSSLEMALRAIGVEGKTVIVPSNTYMATPLAAIKAGAKVIFAECERENLQMDPYDFERKIRKDTVGAILVHIGGIISPSYEKIKNICDQNSLFLLEDAAHAHGATIHGKKAGSLGIAGSFSFYPTKVMTTAEGGMLTTDNEELYSKALVLREHGKADHNFNVHTEIGDNWRFSEIHAVLGIQQMKKVDWILEQRRKIAVKYNEMLLDVKGINPLKVPETIKSSYYKYIVFVDELIDRNKLKLLLKERYDIVLPGEVYSDPCHTQPVFKKYPQFMANSNIDRFPITEYVCRHHVCLPLYPGLEDVEVNYIVNSVKECINHIVP